MNGSSLTATSGTSLGSPLSQFLIEAEGPSGVGRDESPSSDLNPQNLQSAVLLVRPNWSLAANSAVSSPSHMEVTSGGISSDDLRLVPISSNSGLETKSDSSIASASKKETGREFMVRMARRMEYIEILKETHEQCVRIFGTSIVYQNWRPYFLLNSALELKPVIREFLKIAADGNALNATGQAVLKCPHSQGGFAPNSLLDSIILDLGNRFAWPVEVRATALIQKFLSEEALLAMDEALNACSSVFAKAKIETQLVILDAIFHNCMDFVNSPSSPHESAKAISEIINTFYAWGIDSDCLNSRGKKLIISEWHNRFVSQFQSSLTDLRALPEEQRFEEVRKTFCVFLEDEVVGRFLAQTTPQLLSSGVPLLKESSDIPSSTVETPRSVPPSDPVDPGTGSRISIEIH